MGRETGGRDGFVIPAPLEGEATFLSTCSFGGRACSSARACACERALGRAASVAGTEGVALSGGEAQVVLCALHAEGELPPKYVHPPSGEAPHQAGRQAAVLSAAEASRKASEPGANLEAAVKTAETGREAGAALKLEAGREAGAAAKSEAGREAGAAVKLEAGSEAGAAVKLEAGRDAGAAVKLEGGPAVAHPPLSSPQPTSGSATGIPGQGFAGPLSPPSGESAAPSAGTPSHVAQPL